MGSKKAVLLLLGIIFSVNVSAQSYDYVVLRKALDIGEYDPGRVQKTNYRVFYGEEADAELDKVIAEDGELRKYLCYETTDEDGNVYFGREEWACKYYPDLGIIIKAGGHGHTSVFDIRNKKDLCGDPEYYVYSPSDRYRLSALEDDGMKYFLEEMTDEGYMCLGSVYFDGKVSGFYWVDEETIHYLRERQRGDGSLYWMGYSGRFVPVKH